MSLVEDIARLSRTRPFDLLPREALQLVAFSAERRKIAAGESLFEQGDPADCGYFILAGSITMMARGESGEKQRVVGAGALIGEMAMLVESVRPASARAAEDSVALRIPRTVMRRVLEEFPRDAARIRAALAARTRKTAAELDELRKRAIA